MVEGLYAVGECACVSVHGANRLGGNSLLDLVVFGRAAGDHFISNVAHFDNSSLVKDANIEHACRRFYKWNEQKGEYTVSEIKAELKNIMQNDFGVFRTGDVMKEGLLKLNELRDKLNFTRVFDKGNTYNMARIEALELDNLMSVAIATAITANTRTESRGAHSREDFPGRDDVNWIKHILIYHDDRLAFRAVNEKPSLVAPFKPTVRKY